MPETAYAYSPRKGRASLIAYLWLKQAGHEEWFYWYVAGCVFCSLLVYVGMKDTRTHSKIED